MAFRRYDPNEPCVGLLQLLANDMRRDLTLPEMWDVVTTPEYWLIGWSGLALLVIYRYLRWLTVTKFCTVEAPFAALPHGVSSAKAEGSESYLRFPNDDP
ncbi:MAG: hypothetical protein KVP17_001956 [Porospora cf. gigantea B]|uniref:uncharacterized protein n=1 Tax=Porospora cf. gigantea B TaxID=2853592 RepID=UPI0035717F0B|nr:MAG: hypothetical protein KVP17_001956 [Porospora cf. gigantea B]